MQTNTRTHSKQAKHKQTPTTMKQNSIHTKNSITHKNTNSHTHKTIKKTKQDEQHTQETTQQ